MVNHLATLLANLEITDSLLGTPFDLPLSVGYKPVSLSQELLNVRRILFGAEPDNSMLMYRIRQLVLAIGASPLASYATHFDAREIDLKRVPSRFLGLTGVPKISATPTGAADKLNIIGKCQPCDDSGRMRQLFVVSVEAGLARVQGPSGYDITTTAGTIPLAKTGISVLTTDPVSAQTFTIDFFAPAQRSFGQLVAALQDISEATRIALFGTTEEEPLASYRRAFEQSKNTVLQISAMALALAHRTEERRLPRA